MTTRLMKTITIELPEEFANKIDGIDLAMSIAMAYCGLCGGDINGHTTKHNWCVTVDSDHWQCQGADGCYLSYCDECVRKTTAEDDDRPDGFFCHSCAEEDAGFQQCEGDECEHYRWGDEGHWTCHDGGIDKVLCPECEGKLTAEQKERCGCDQCADEVAEA
jgi:hypothetical protein